MVLKLGDEVRAEENIECHQRPLKKTRGKQTMKPSKNLSP